MHTAHLEALFDRSYDRIYRYCVVRTGSDQAAQDITAETFADAARSMQRGVQPAPDLAWLFMVARRRIVDHWRAAERQRRKIELIVAQPRHQLDGDQLGDDPAAELVRAALADMPDRQRSALILRYIDEHSVGEIAVTLDMSYRAAESLLARARRTFVQAWRQQR